MVFIEKISRVDAAKRQLETAIKLIAQDGDPVAIHTLAAASQQILRDLGKLRDIESPIYEAGQKYFKSEEEYKKYINTVRLPQNAFKHATNPDIPDPLEYNSNLAELIVFDAAEIYNRLTGERPVLQYSYCIWFVFKNPNIISDKSFKEKLEKLKYLSPNDKSIITELADLLK